MYESQMSESSSDVPDFGWPLNGFNASANIDQTMDPAVLQQTRHARRLYVGGIPQNYANEELIIKYFNSIISEGLGEENDNSYVNSVYINHKKCFAFVELKSMELTTACLELDGIVYHNSILKIQRANEYKPELVPGSIRPPLKLKLPSSAYLGSASAAVPELREKVESRIGTLLQQGSMSIVEAGSIVLVGFPYDEGARRGGGSIGSANGPKVIRRYLRRVGTIHNPEYDLDLTNLRLIDLGDVATGLTLEEAHSRLMQTVADVIRRGALPIVIGGSGDMSYNNVSALMEVAGGNIGVINVNSRLDVRPPNMEGKSHNGTPFRQLLEDTRFCAPRDGLNSMPSCEGKFVSFAAQGSLCSDEHTKFIQSRGGYILWLAKDLRSSKIVANSPSTSRSGQIFRDALRILGENPSSGSRRPLFVSLRMNAMNAAVCPGVDETNSLGLNSDEALEMCMTCGSDQNVVLFDLSEFNPEVEEARSGKLIAEMIYYFVLGFAARLTAAGTLPKAPPPSLAPAPFPATVSTLRPAVPEFRPRSTSVAPEHNPYYNTPTQSNAHMSDSSMGRQGNNYSNAMGTGLSRGHGGSGDADLMGRPGVHGGSMGGGGGGMRHSQGHGPGGMYSGGESMNANYQDPMRSGPVNGAGPGYYGNQRYAKDKHMQQQPPQQQYRDHTNAGMGYGGHGHHNRGSYHNASY